MVLLDPFEQLDTTALGHAVIGKDDINTAAAQQLLGGRDGVGCQYLKLASQQGREGAEDVGFIIHHE